jgi:hypothetical protein
MALVRNNRGFSPFGNVTPTLTSGTYYSAYDCYVSVSGLPAGATIALTGTTGSPQDVPISGSAANFLLFAGAKLALSYSGGSPSWSWFCN